jgi:hypothetical protein
MMVMILAVRMILGVIRRRLRQVNACLGYFPEISVCFVPVYNGHNASEPLVEIPLDHRNQLVRSLKLRRKCLQLRGENVKSNVPLDQLSHQAIERPPAGSNELQNLFAFPISLKSAFNRLGLPLDSTDAG